MSLQDQMSDAFDKWCDEGPEALSPEEQLLYLAADFENQVLNGGLSQYLYNRLPDHDEIQRTIAALDALGLQVHNRCLSGAYELFKTYVDPDEQSTWGDQCAKYDPKGHLDVLTNEFYDNIN